MPYAASCTVTNVLWVLVTLSALCFFFQAEDGIRDVAVTGVQTCALPIFPNFSVTRGFLALVFRHSPHGQNFAAERVGQQALQGSHLAPSAFLHRLHDKIGRASCRERV